MSRRDLTDEQWERLRPLLPPQKARRGRPPKDHRQIVNGLLWLNRISGAVILAFGLIALVSLLPLPWAAIGHALDL